MEFNNDPDWMRKKTEAEDGCDVSVGSLTGPVFTELNPPERKRTYVYRDGSELTIENITRICIRPSGSNRLETADGKKWVILAGFVAVRLEVDSWTF